MNSTTMLQGLRNRFDIQPNNAFIPSMGKFTAGSVGKCFVLGASSLEFGFAKIGSIVIRNRASDLTAAANRAAATFKETLKLLNRPFAPETKRTKVSYGFFQKKEIRELLEGPTASSCVRAFAEKNQAKITLAAILSAVAVSLYFFAPDSLPFAPDSLPFVPDSPLFGPDSPLFGPDSPPKMTYPPFISWPNISEVNVNSKISLPMALSLCSIFSYNLLHACLKEKNKGTRPTSSPYVKNTVTPEPESPKIQSNDSKTPDVERKITPEPESPKIQSNDSNPVVTEDNLDQVIANALSDHEFMINNPIFPGEKSALQILEEWGKKLDA